MSIPMTDWQLLQKYVETGDQDAFAQLVAQHVDVVYSAARRQAHGDAHLAEEITQQTFILLAQKAKSLGPDVLIGGWLYNSVRFIAHDLLRKEQRREHYEHKAAAMAQEIRNAAAPPGKQDAWDDAETVLDDAMNDLDEPTRGLLVQR
jgi:RNA polymerase sigma factor (sigma-70 family)